MDWKAQPARTWLVVGLVVTLAHAGAWYGIKHLRDEAPPARTFKVIEAALLSPPAPAPMPHLLPVAPPPPRKTPPPPRPQAAPAPLPVAAPAVPAAEPRPAQIVAAPPAPEPEPEPPAIVAPAPVPVPSPPPAPAILEAPRFNAAYLNNPSPTYPALARRRGQEGRVLVRAEVLPDGRCSRVELRQGSGHALLDEAALEAVRKWRFVPARKGDVAVSAWVDVPIAFKLNN